VTIGTDAEMAKFRDVFLEGLPGLIRYLERQLAVAPFEEFQAEQYPSGTQEDLTSSACGTSTSPAFSSFRYISDSSSVFGQLFRGPSSGGQMSR